MSRNMFRVAMLLCITAALAVSLGCGKPVNVEKPIPVSTPQAQKPVEPPAKLPPPAPAEVESAIGRIFGNDLVLERTGQWFIVGDFNGDSYEDVAVIARVNASKLDDINGELANWTIQDADKFFVPPSGKRVVQLPHFDPVKLNKGEEILAIIHGYGPKGWRNPDARQAYLVRHAAASFAGLAPSISVKSIRAMRLPIQTEMIKEIRNNKKGFLFWTG